LIGFVYNARVSFESGTTKFGVHLVQTVSGNVRVKWRRISYLHYVGLNRDMGVITTNENGAVDRNQHNRAWNVWMNIPWKHQIVNWDWQCCILGHVVLCAWLNLVARTSAVE
jgi:hypothetical protein